MTFRRCRATRGFTLVHMLVALVLVSAFGLLAAQLFYTTGRLLTETERADALARRSDAMVRRLRADVWASRSATSGDPATLTIAAADGRTITWQSEQDGSVVRNARGGVAPEAEQRWAVITPRISFATSGPIVELRTGNEVARLVSQQQALAAEAP